MFNFVLVILLTFHMRFWPVHMMRWLLILRGDLIEPFLLSEMFFVVSIVVYVLSFNHVNVVIAVKASSFVPRFYVFVVFSDVFVVGFIALFVGTCMCYTLLKSRVAGRQ